MGYGYGTVYQRTSDNRWVAAVELPRQRGEARTRKVFTSLSKVDADLWLASYRAEVPALDRLGERAAYMERARALGTHTRAEWWALVRKTRGCCAYCGRDTLDFEMDHIIPVSRGGSDAIDNIAVACHDCNAEKGTMTGDEYRAWKAGRQ